MPELPNFRAGGFLPPAGASLGGPDFGMGFLPALVSRQGKTHQCTVRRGAVTRERVPSIPYVIYPVQESWRRIQPSPMASRTVFGGLGSVTYLCNMSIWISLTEISKFMDFHDISITVLPVVD